MLFLRLFSYLLGYLIIEIRGTFAQRLINLLPRNRIYIWKISHSPDGMRIRCKIKIRDFKKLRPFVRRTKTRVHIVKKRGIPFIIHKYRHRYGLAIGLMVFAATVYILSQVIWKIDIVGNTSVQASQILSVLKAEGFDTGKFRWFVNTRDAEVIIKRNFSTVTWAQVNIDGSRLVIEIKEMQEYGSDPDINTPCNIVADRDCVITDLIVLEGQATVKPGTAVAKGDLLVSGIKDQRFTAPDVVHSNALITGEYTVTVTSSMPIQYTALRKTGRKYTRFCLQIFNNRVKLYIGNKVKYNTYSSETFVSEVKPFGFALPIATESEEIYETVPTTVTVSAEEAMALAQTEYDARARIQLANCNILSADISQEVSDSGVTLTGVYKVQGLVGIKQIINQ